ALGALGVGALHQGIACARLGDRALGVVDDQAFRNGAEPLEGAAVTAQPGRHRLIPDEFDVLVTREAQRHHEAPRATYFLARGVVQHRPGAEVDLRRFARAKLQAYRRLGRAACRERPEHPPNRRVTAAVAVLAAQRRVDRYTADPALGPTRNDLAKRLNAGNGAA